MQDRGWSAVTLSCAWLESFGIRFRIDLSHAVLDSDALLCLAQQFCHL